MAKSLFPVFKESELNYQTINQAFLLVLPTKAPVLHPAYCVIGSVENVSWHIVFGHFSNLDKVISTWRSVVVMDLLTRMSATWCMPIA